MDEGRDWLKQQAHTSHNNEAAIVFALLALIDIAESIEEKLNKIYKPPASDKLGWL